MAGNLLRQVTGNAGLPLPDRHRGEAGGEVGE